MRLTLMIAGLTALALACAGCGKTHHRFEPFSESDFATSAKVRLIGIVMRSGSTGELKYIDVTKFAVGGLAIDPTDLRVPSDFVAFQYKLILTSTAAAGTDEYTFALGRESGSAASNALAKWETPSGGLHLQSGWFYLVRRWPYARTGTTIGPSVHQIVSIAPPPGPPPHLAIAVSTASGLDRWYLINADRSLSISTLNSTSTVTLTTKDTYVEATATSISAPIANNDPMNAANVERAWITTVIDKFPWP
ncbi:MAG: hypothetical protein ACKVS9_10055 [Phycisphaerae bacterium]